ncbi:MAG TPA: crosslink repair DNA glycosylase YcaQ family protein [Acidimicrobiales bacterium]|nr:crosslink repair DNA glycosylase YcaQ family protein [Acidimicrobiales bacterium]
MPVPTSLSRSQARRLVLSAQGLARPRPPGRIDRRHLRRVAQDLGLVQIDSVNVLVRAHHMPFFSRLGPHDPDLLHRLAYRDRRLFEYWAHEASLVDVELEPLLRWRMAEEHRWGGPKSVGRERPDLVAEIEALVLSAEAPLTAAEVDARVGTAQGRAGAWWGWSDTKKALEHLFWGGRVGAVRRASFERAYCPRSATVPAEVLDRPTPSVEEAHRGLLLVAARAHGVATPKDLADYWRLPIREVRRLVAAMVHDGSLTGVEVEGWRELAVCHPDATLPRRVAACALVSPFDQAMWERSRVERVHGFRYAIEIYVPKHQRRHGYYVLPFLLGDTFVARVDLKADRTGRRLQVQAAWHEPDLAERGTDVDEVAVRLGDELRSLAGWLDLEDVVVEPAGDLAPALLATLSRGGG